MKKLFSKIAALGAMMLGAFTIHGAANKAPVTANAAGEETWGLVGSMTGWADGKDIPFVWNAGNNRYELEITFKTNEQFKIRKDQKWGVEIGWWNDSKNTNIDNHKEYLQDAGGNFKVILGGDYLLTLDANISSIDPKASGFRIEAKSTVEPEPEPELGTEKWGLVGTMTNWADGKDIPFVWDEVKEVYELEYTFSVGNTFKIRRGGSWDNAMGWYNDNKNIDNHKQYLKEAAKDGNFEVTVAGTYVLTLAGNISKLNPYNDGFTLAPKSDPVDPVKPDEWSLISNMNGDNFSVDIPFVLNEEKTAYELEVSFEVGNQFKIRRNGSWKDEDVMGWYNDSTNIENHKQYLKEAAVDANFEVTVAGTYMLSLAGNISETAPFNNAFTITKLTEDPVKPDEWTLIGDMNGDNFSVDIPFVLNEEKNVYELEVSFEVGDQFKIRRNGSWDAADVMGWYNDSANIENHKQYLKEAATDANFEVTAAGTYMLRLAGNISETTPFNNAFTIELLQIPDNKVDIKFGEEVNLPADEYVYWNDQWWCGSSVVVSEHYLSEDGTAHFTFKTDEKSGTCDFGFQVFYKNTSLTEGKSYTITFDLYSSIECELEINHSNATEGRRLPISVGTNHIVYTYLQGSNASLHIGCSSDYAKETPVTFEISNVEWKEPANPQIEADKFVQEWLALRNAEGSICDQVKGDATALKDMIAKYDALAPEVKTIVDASLDREGNTIQNSVEYLRSFLGLDEAPSADKSTGGLLLTAVKDNACTIAIVMALVAGTFVGYIILRRKNKLVKTSK